MNWNTCSYNTKYYAIVRKDIPPGESLHLLGKDSSKTTSFLSDKEKLSGQKICVVKSLEYEGIFNAFGMYFHQDWLIPADSYMDEEFL